MIEKAIVKQQFGLTSARTAIVSEYALGVFTRNDQYAIVVSRAALEVRLLFSPLAWPFLAGACTSQAADEFKNEE